MNWENELKMEEIEEVKEEIESYGAFIETVNPDNIWEVNEEDFQRLTEELTPEIVKEIKKWEIPLFYTKLGNFYPFLEHKTEDFFEFLQKYKEELRDWYKREECFFEDYESAESIYKIYHELFDMEEEQIDSWYDNELDSLSWREVYISKANGVVFLIDEGGYGTDIAIIYPEWDITNIVKRLKEGEPLHKICKSFVCLRRC